MNIICLCGLILGFGITGCQAASQPVVETAVPTVLVTTAPVETSTRPAPTLLPVEATVPVTETAIHLTLPSEEPISVGIPVTAATATVLPTITDLPTQTATSSPTVESPQPAATVTDTALPSATELPTATPTETLPAVTPTISETALSTPTEMATESPTDITPTLPTQIGVSVTAVQDTTCRRHPTRNSNPLGNLVVNATAVVEGKDSSGEWFFIVNPTNPVERMCWVWSGTLTVVGDVSTLEIIPDTIND